MNVKVGETVIRNKDKRTGKVVATKGGITTPFRIQVKWKKGLTRWHEPKDITLTQKVVA